MPKHRIENSWLGGNSVEKDLGLVLWFFSVAVTSAGVSAVKLTSYCLAAIDLLQNYLVVFLNSFSAGSTAQLADVESLEPSQGTQ